MKKDIISERDVLINWLKFLEIKDLNSNIIDIKELRKIKGDDAIKALSVTDYHSFREEFEIDPNMRKIIFSNKNILETLKNKYELNFAEKYKINVNRYEGFKKKLIDKNIIKGSYEWNKELLREGFLEIKNSIFINVFSINLFKNKNESFPDLIEPFFKIRLDTTHQMKLYESESEFSFYFNLDSGSDFVINTAAFIKYTKLNPEDLYLENNISFKRFIKLICKKDISSLSEGMDILKHFIVENISFSDDSMYQFNTNNNKQTDQYYATFSKSIIFIQANEKANIFKSSLSNDLKYLIQNPKALSPYIKQYLINTIEENQATQHMNKDVTWKGAFGDYPMAKGQAIVMQEKQKKRDLIAVVGAPGTGKTTLFLSIIANEITNRALTIAHGHEDYNSSIIITSSTNKAIDNIIDEFKKIYPDRNDFYFIGGNDSNLKVAKERVGLFIEELQTKEFDEEKYNLKKKELLKQEYEIIQEEMRYKQAKQMITSLKIYNSYSELKEEVRRYNEDKISIGYLKEEILIAEKEKTDLEEKFKIVETKLELINKMREVCSKYTPDIFFIDKNDIELENMERIILEYKNLNFFIKLFSKKSYNSKVVKIFNSNINLNKILDMDEAEEFLFYFNKYKNSNLNEEESKDLEISLKRSIASNLNKREDLINKITIFEEYYKIKSLGVEEILEKYNSYPEYFRMKKVKEAKNMFMLSNEFLQLHVLKNKNAIINSLTVLKSGNRLYLKDSAGFKIDKSKLNEFLKNISLVYPVFSSTLMSMDKNFYLKLDEIDCEPIYNTCLADESGMIKAHEFISAAIRSKSAIVVGDPKQLEPVESGHSISIDTYKREFINDKNEFNEVRYNRYSIFETNAYYRAALCSYSTFEHNGNGIVLDEHRRCQLDIANLFKLIAKYPADLKVETAPLSEEDLEKLEKMGGKNLIFYDIKGESNAEKSNYIEEDYIGEVLNKLSEVGYDLGKDVGIITPYKPQANNLITRYGKILNHSETTKKIGTVHSFQGAEFKVILFSTVVHNGMTAGNFFSESLFNVSVSRAKHLFINIGDLSVLGKQGPLLETYIAYIEKYGFIHNVNKRIDIDKYKKEDSNIKDGDLIFSCDHLPFIEKAIERAEKEIIIVSPFSHENNEKQIKLNREWFNKLNEIKNKRLQSYPGLVLKLVFNYNYETNANQKTQEEIRDVERKMKEMIPFVDQAYYLKGGTHEKNLIIDKKEMVVTSFNWISQGYLTICNNSNAKKVIVRRETGLLTKNLETINTFYTNLRDQIAEQKNINI